jgi:RNA polymerase sigma factor (sigma-70 family)
MAAGKAGLDSVPPAGGLWGVESDSELLAGVSRGDAEAWKSLLGRHEAFVLGLACERLRRAGFGRAEAEEVVQEVWLSFLARGGAVPDLRQGLQPYLAAAVLNTARLWLRSGGRLAVRERSHAPRPPAPEVPDESLIRAERTGRLEAALARLGLREQMLLRWTYWEALDYRAIAGLMGVSENSVGPMLSQARQGLRRLLESEKPDTEEGGRGNTPA